MRRAYIPIKVMFWKWGGSSLMLQPLYVRKKSQTKLILMWAEQLFFPQQGEKKASTLKQSGESKQKQNPLDCSSGLFP